MADDKKAKDLSGINKNLNDRLKNVNETQSVFAKGLGGDPLYEAVPTLIKTSNEKIYENGHNACIVLGRDRPKSRLSGYGGRGDSGAGSIDIVVGRQGYLARAFDVGGKRVFVDPDFKADAARIYISQKANIDEYFSLVPGSVGMSRTKSAIGLKADAVRIISREGIKLITGGDDKNSQGGDIKSILGIDLIAGNNDENLQPIPLGNNTVDAIARLTHHLDKLAGVVDSILMTQTAFNDALTHHFHQSPFFGLPTTPSIALVPVGIKTSIDHLLQNKRSLITIKANLALYKMNYLNPAGSKYLNSRWNRTN